ncbi:MAG TPA: HAMP domain-containing sensor histidine kinase [Sphingomicrobium sp.]|nr:HAMP domain-containing sensor histidine kinase [Sphingomicrobium sp.]
MVSAVIVLAVLAAGFFVRLELIEGGASAVMAREYVELLGLLAPFAIAAPIAAYLAARWSLRPLARIEGEAKAVEPANPDQRLSEERAPPEALGLVRAVNAAFERMAAAYNHERQFTANAAHALRTPLAVLSLRLQEAIAAGQLDRRIYTEDLERLRRVVDQLLTLGRFEAAKTHLQPDHVDLSRVARSVAAELLPMAEAQGKVFELAADHAHVGAADAESTSLIVRNLVENALLHGQGAVHIATGGTSDGAWLTVCDQGSGPSANLRINAFERFVRGDGSKGSGLGLAVARDIAVQLGGRLEWEEGSTIRLTLLAPRADL